ncbi:CHAT domain-containing protein [Suillus ampliporus]|nr:CHAT domain-containing protein [Suillus ampliporus]
MTDAGHCLLTRYHRTQDSRDLDQSITHFQRASDLCPLDHLCHPAALFNLATAKFICCQVNGTYLDLDIPISLFQDALDMRSTGHPDRPITQFHLSMALLSRFARRDDSHALDEVISRHYDALEYYSPMHAARGQLLCNLSTMLLTRFERRGNSLDLDKGIGLQKEALALHPVGHPDRSASLNNLANGLSTRFGHRGNDQDLDESVVLHREALALRPVGHPDRSVSLNNLASGLSTRFWYRGNDQDLDEAIALHREALALRPVCHPDRSKSLNTLANGLSTRFGHRGNDQDLDEAIVLHREALALRPVGHPDRSGSLINLANQLSTRFEHRGNAQDLNDSLEHLRSTFALLTQHDPRQLIVHSSLSSVYLLFHQSALDLTGQDTGSLNAAMHHLKTAANFVSGSLRFRLRVSLHWVRYAVQHAHATELESYSTSMHLLDASMSATASVSSRHNAMKDFPSTLAVDAASCALRHDNVCRAVELLEQGRTLIWTQMARLRTPLDSLQERGDHAQALMKKFRDLSSLLDKPPTDHSEATPRVDVEAEATRYRRLVQDWNTTVEEIRKVEGLAHFLLPPLFSDLQDAAREGPIIVLVASKSSCDAIVIPHTEPPTHVQLPTNLEKLRQLVNTLRQTVEAADPKGKQPVLIKVLRELWDDIVCPVVEHLGRFARQGARIWWCPTSFFSFLPLHAAGEYRENGKSISQLYVSSYTPSLTALIRARKSKDGFPSGSFAAIGQNHPPGHSFTLEAVEPELKLVQSLLPLPPAVSFTKVTSVESTKSRVMHALQDNHWLHFACHGTQDLLEPFKSAFLMRDHPLSLLDIAQTNLSRHEFAFLSACETAVVDFQTPDEVIHLAAGLQFAGVKSVVGTTWKVTDATVRHLVEAFYKNFCRDGKMNSKRAARALHKAVQSLKNVPLDQRIVFIHIGI